MPNTERLYYDDPHLTDFDARVLSVLTGTVAHGDRTAVRLDRTAFYPTGGGQPTDTGTLGRARVVECAEDEESGDVLHFVEGEAPAVGALVNCRVDWPRRLSHIQQHTGQHILSQAFLELHRAETRSFRMTSDAAEIDLDLQDPSDEKIERAADRANEIIWSDRPVRVHHVTPEEAARLPLRKDSAREGSLRVIEIEGFDFSPCGGTHARRTGEVGLVAVRHWERAKGLTRVTFVAGTRALDDYRRANHAARAAAAPFSAARDEAPAAVARLLEEHKHALRRLRELTELAARAEARDLYEEAADTSLATTDTPVVVARVFENRDAEDLKQLALALARHPRALALLGSRDGATARLVFARAPDLPHDMNALLRTACALLEGRGGGRPDLAQGGGPRPERLPEAIAAARHTLA
jgi:alanyl-tRNA synthetase